MKRKIIMGALITIAAMLCLSACNKNTPAADTTAASESTVLPPAQESGEKVYVEGIAGGIMTSTLQLQAEVVSVDQEKREAVLRGPEGNEVVVKVGKNAVNFYQVAPGDKVDVTMMHELVVYVPADEQTTEDGTVAIAAGAQEGDSPAGAIVASSKVTGKVTALDTTARTATLSFEDDSEEEFEVRPDVDLTKYAVGDEVVFMITEMLALEVKKP